MTVVLEHDLATVTVEECGPGSHVVEILPKDSSVRLPFSRWTTQYPVDFIEHAVRVKGLSTIDELRRSECTDYVAHHLRLDLFSYVPPARFADCRVLDFGSGSGASAAVLAPMIPPSASIVGVELNDEHIDLARRRIEHHGLGDRVVFRRSPDAASLPADLGDFDFVLLSAVYEHLLPEERRPILQLVWEHLKPGGVLFIEQTPYRWFPFESHTTGLPLINYLPDRLAHRAACRFSSRVRPGSTWSELLRRGVRGGSEREIRNLLQADGRHFELLQPGLNGVRDHADLWYRVSAPAGRSDLKRNIARVLRATTALTGELVVPSLALAYRKLS